MFAKKLFICGLLFLLCLPAMRLSASAQTVAFKAQKLSVDLPDGYIILNQSNSVKNKELLKKLGYTVSSFNQKLDKKQKNDLLLLFAVTPDATRQINLNLSENDFSKTAYDLTDLPDNQRISARDMLIQGVKNADGIQVLSTDDMILNGALFIRITATVHATRDFCFVEYASVINGKYCALTYYNNAPTLSEAELAEADTVFSSLSFRRIPEIQTQKTVFSAILNGAVIAVVGGIILFIIFTLLRDLVRYYISRSLESERLNHKYKKHFGPKHRV